ncbi:unnamed protein product, partial [Medioppia subpectinata]
MAQQKKQMMASLETTDDGERDQRKEIYAKNSMDRFGDDMCALILSYLSLEDRFRLECVSKQFQRTVFGSVVDITLNYRLIRKLLNETTIKTQLLTTIGIKCPKIQTIDCQMGAEYEKHISEVLAIFRDNYLNLREIYCNLWPNCEQTMLTIGPLVTRINVYDNTNDTQSLTHCHRLSHLFVSRLSQVFDTSGQLMAKNLNKFELYSYSDEDYHRLSAFVAHNESLKCLNVNNNIRVSEESLTRLSAQLSRLTQLRRLRLALNITGAQTSLTDCLHAIGVNCKQLQRLSLHLSHTDSHGFNHKTLDSLRFCHRLKRLELRIAATNDEISLDPLRHCKGLMHLELDLLKMTANVLKDLHIKCPRLQYLFIEGSNHFIDTDFKTQLSHISRLPALQMLVIDCNPCTDLSYNDFNDLLSRSPKLKTIKANQSSN